MSDGQTLIGFDAAQDVTRILRIAKAAGIAWVGRYYSFNAKKNLTAAEAKAILDAGLDIVTVWEARGDKWDSFFRDNGTREATAALAQAKECGQPSNTCIYFAVDFDARSSEISQNVIPYFDAINAALAGHYKIGVYGSGLVCSELDSAGLVSYDWLSGAMGWQGSRAYANAHLTEIEQGGAADPWGFGFNVDRNTAPVGRDFGSWLGGSLPSPTPAPPRNVIDEILSYARFHDGVYAYQEKRGLALDGTIGKNTLRQIGIDMAGKK